jgi:hypothetical protein
MEFPMPNATVLRLLLVVGLALSVTMTAAGAQPTKAGPRVWSFESDDPGKIPKGFTAEVGTWEVAAAGGNRVLFQKAKNANPVYNVALAQGTSFKDLDLSVRVKPVDGEIDQGGGLVWRARDKDNYYICRYNPLEDNYRVYKVEKGKRTQLATANVPRDEAWHTVRATMAGAKITCYLDGKKLLEVEDATFAGAGMIGLWSKADAQTYFDDLIAVE